LHRPNQKGWCYITKIKQLPEHDLLTAGVPCQSWSIAGKNLGFHDDRGQLWNDTLYLLQQSQPKVFIFENVKGLVDPRNKNALSYILNRIKEAGYYANYFIINSFDYGVPQHRIRVYIIGFREELYFQKFVLPQPLQQKRKLGEVLGIMSLDLPTLAPIPLTVSPHSSTRQSSQLNLFGDLLDKSLSNSFGTAATKAMSLSTTNGFNDYFLFNDLRNGATTIHSWDILETTQRQKDICLLLLQNRRKKIYGALDGNPLSLQHFQNLDPSIVQAEIDELIQLKILKAEEYRFFIKPYTALKLTNDEQQILGFAHNQEIIIDQLKQRQELKLKKISIPQVIEALKRKQVIECVEVRYDFKNTKISTGLFGINRIFLPSSDIFPTLVASDTHDFITLKTISASDPQTLKQKFMTEVYQSRQFRKITKREACLIQGFPEDFKLPESRSRWMKLIGNSVSVPVIDTLCKAIMATGVFDRLPTDHPPTSRPSIP